MTRKIFLTISSCIALLVGMTALGAPAFLLAGKGIRVETHDPVITWVREVGVAILAWGVTGLLARSQPDSPMMRVFLFGNAVIHIGLFPIEIIAHLQGVIPSASSIAPNSVLHVVLGLGFLWFATRARAFAPRQS